jgi:hypothetical protein
MRRLENSETQNQGLYLQTYVKVGRYVVIFFVRLITKHYKTEENICKFLIASPLCSTRLFSINSTTLKNSKCKEVTYSYVLT